VKEASEELRRVAQVLDGDTDGTPLQRNEGVEPLPALQKLTVKLVEATSGEGARAENAILVIDGRRDASILTNIDSADDATLLSFHDRYSSPGLGMHERLNRIFCSFPVPAARWLRPQYNGS
jgi:hypothetical protein